MVCLRAGMVMVYIMRHLSMKDPGRNAERRQQQERAIGYAQAQGAQTTPVSVSQAVVSPQGATESVRLWQGMTYHGDLVLWRIIHRCIAPS